MKTLAITALLSAALVMTACNDEPPNPELLASRVDETMADFRNGKEQVTAELRALREDLAVERTKAEQRLKDPKLNMDQRKEWEAFKDEVEAQIERVDRQLDDVGSATAETWEKVKAATQKAAAEVGDWFKRQAEKVDRKTRTDRVTAVQ
ncbi:MAG TPA: hypothetical protein PKY96_13540 [Flavobacteriales bacterium]|nr:hypothetical protein [Flavobacteriales bacterium]